MELKKLILRLKELNRDVELLKENLNYYIEKDELTKQEWREWKKFKDYLLMRYKEIKLVRKEIEKYKDKK